MESQVCENTTDRQAYDNPSDWQNTVWVQRRFDRSRGLMKAKNERTFYGLQAQAIDPRYDLQNDKRMDKPRCYDHGCDGRTFASQANYRRHIREKDEKRNVQCSFCFVWFTRKSNRDNHVRMGKCKIFEDMLKRNMRHTDTLTAF